MLKNELIPPQLIKISNFKKLEISEPKTFFQLIYTFPNNDYLFESLQYFDTIKYEIRTKKPNQKELEMKLKFELEQFFNYSVINYLFIAKYDDYINIYKFINNNSEYYLKQKIIIDEICPSLSYNGYFMKTIKQNQKYENNNEIIDIIIQPNRNIKNYFRIFRSDENTNFKFYDKILINDGDELGFIFIDAKNNNLLSFVEKANDTDPNSKSIILKYDLFTYKQLKSIIIKDLKKYNSQFGYRQELKIYKNSFLFIHNNVIKIFSLEELRQNIFQIVNSRNILGYQCSTISHIDNSLLIAQGKIDKLDFSYIRQYILDDESLELIETDSIKIEVFIKDIFNYIDGYIIKYININNEVKFTLLYK